MMISNEDLVASKPLYQILIDCDPDAPYLYAPFKVLNTCRLRGQSTKGVKTDIKRQTFRVANLPSAWTSNLEDIAVEEEEEIPIPDGSRMPGPHTTGVRLVATSLDSDTSAPTLGVNISTATVYSANICTWRHERHVLEHRKRLRRQIRHHCDVYGSVGGGVRQLRV